MSMENLVILIDIVEIGRQSDRGDRLVTRTMIII